MSFNPFDPIRKYQKSFLAAACILCMIVFIFSFGPGDLFQTLLGKMGARNTGPTVATLAGQDVTTGDLDRIRRLRERASDFMVQACGYQYSVQENYDRDRAKEKTPPVESPELMERRQSLYAFAQWAQNPTIFGGGPTYFGDNVNSNDDNLDWIVWQKEADRLGIQVSAKDLAKIFNRETSTSDWWKPGSSITLIPGMERFFSKDQFALKDMGADDVLDTLCQEFRVLFAKEAILGISNGPRLIRNEELRRNSVNFGKYMANPLAPTPAEFKDFYKKQRTTVNALVLPVETTSFISDKTGEKPSEETLKALFDSGKEKEQDSSLDRPGFKTPRKVQVAYITSTTDKPWYKTALARIQVQRILAPALADAGLGGPGLALSSLWSWADNGDPATGNLGVIGWMNPYMSISRRDELVGNYDLKLRNSRLRGGLLESWLTAPIDQVHAIHAVRPLPIASFVLANASGLQGFGALVSSDTLWKATASKTEGKDRVPLIAKSRLIGLAAIQPSGGFLPVVASISSVIPSLPKSFEETNINQAILPELVNLSGREDFEATWKRLKTAIAAFKGKTDKSEAETFIAGEVKRLGLTFKSMTSPKDRFDIAKDPAFDIFRGAYEIKNALSTNAPPFAFKFFQTQGTYDPQGWASNVDETSPFSAENWSASTEPFLFWRTEDIRPQARTFEQAKADVEKFWLNEKFGVAAAREKAQAIAAEANALLAPEDKTNADPKKKYWATTYRDILPEAVTFLSSQKLSGKPSAPFEIENVSRLVPQKTTNPFQPAGYEFFRFQPTQIPFPRENFLDQILSLEKPGQATVLRDRPGNTFYVVVLLSRNEPSPADFQRAFERAGADFDRDDMWSRFYNENRQKFDIGAMKMLRSEATGGKVDENGRIKTPANLDKKQQDNFNQGLDF